jgi:hypothetical protein
MRFACLTNATGTHSLYEILTDFPRQEWLRERASMLRLCVRCLPYCKCVDEVFRDDYGGGGGIFWLLVVTVTTSVAGRGQSKLNDRC